MVRETELLRVERLPQESLRSAGLGLAGLVCLDLAAEHDHLDRVDAVALPDPLEHLPAVDLGHHHVEEDQVGRLGLERLEPLLRAPRLANRVAVHLEVDADELANPRVVVDDQHEGSGSGARGRRTAGGAGDERVEVALAVSPVSARRVERGQPALVGPFPDRALGDAEIPRRLPERQPVSAAVCRRLPARFAPCLGHRRRI